MTHKIKQILTATLAILIVASISACTDSPTNSSTSKIDSDTTSSVVDVESSVPETSVTDTAVPETTLHTEDTSVETPKPETTVQIVTEAPETSSVPESEAPKPETTVTTTTTTVATTKPAPEWTETKVSGTKYVNTGCYSRKKAVLGAETVKLYNVNDKVTVTAKTDTGYFKLDNGAFIHGDYLSDSKVAVPAITTTTTKKQEISKPAENTSSQQNNESNSGPYAWTEDDVHYVFNEVKKYADSVGFTNYDFPTKIEHFKDEFSFGGWGGYNVTGRVWLEGFKDEGLFFNNSSNKKDNIEYFINDYKKCIDDFMNPDSGIEPSENCGFKITWTTGKDMLKYYEACGWSTEGHYIANCDIDTAYVFISNH